MSQLVAELERDGIVIDRGHVLPMAMPKDQGELVSILLRTVGTTARVVPVGFGTHLACCRPEVVAGRADLLLSTQRLARIVEYVPGDGTVTVEAGATLAAIADTVAGGGHRLSPQLAAPERTTIGGALAGGLSGPDRVRVGPARHHVLGLSVAHADGRLSKSGGKLVKNVTGFDLHRLYVGSRGTLVVLLEASLRLFPEPECVRALVWEAPRAAELLAVAEALRASTIEPLALMVRSRADGEHARVELVLAGRAAQVASDQALASHLAGCAPDAMRESTTTRAALAPLAAAEGHPDHGWPQARCDALPGAIAALAADFERNAAHERWVAQPSAGTLFVFAPELVGATSAAQLAHVRKWSECAARHGAHLRPLALSAAIHEALAPRVTAGGKWRWMEALRSSLDPAGRFRSPFFPAVP